VCVGVVGLEDIEEAMDVCLRASLSRKLKFSNMNTKANVFEFMFENRVFKNERVPAGFFCFSVMKNTNQHFVL
jgi:hypothetical protein